MAEKIDISKAKCSKLSFESVVNFKKEGEKADISGFEIEAYTGAVVDRWWGKLAINVAGINAKQQMPIFKNHDPDKIVGYSISTAKDSSFWVSGVFSDATEAAKEVKGLAAEGFPWQASIGVRPNIIMELKDGFSMIVNGSEVFGPAEVWMESEVVETSFVPLGADSNTRVAVFSELPETATADKQGAMMPEIQEVLTMMTLEKLKQDHPDLVQAIVVEALAGMDEKLAKAKEEGATAENQRIKEVKMQLVPGHEALIEAMAFDGKSTAADAALAIVAAEQKVRSIAAENFVKDAPDVVPVVNNDSPEKENLSAPIEERAKAAWDKSPETREEFRDNFGAYLSFRKADAAGQAKIFGKK